MNPPASIWALKLGGFLLIIIAFCGACGSDQLRSHVSKYIEITQAIGDSHLKKYGHATSPWLIDIESKTLSRGEVTGPIEFCESDADFVCVLNDSLPFAAPKKLPNEGGSWEFNGFKYQLTNKNINIAIFGRGYKVHEIKVIVPSVLEDISNPEEFVFYYSDTEGLVAFSQRIVECNKVPTNLLFGQSACDLGGLFIHTSGPALFSTREH